MKPAVFCGGQVASGCHHAEAYSHICNKNESPVSGYIDNSGEFIAEGVKTLLCIRHAQSLNNVNKNTHLNSDLTNEGEIQAYLLAESIVGDYSCFVSPMLRCLKTARYIQRKTGLKFKVCPELCEISWVFPAEGLTIDLPIASFPDMDWGVLAGQKTVTLPKEEDGIFLAKMRKFYESLPENSLLVTHGTCVMTLIELGLGAIIEKIPAWDGSIFNASSSMVSQGRLHYINKVV